MVSWRGDGKSEGVDNFAKKKKSVLESEWLSGWRGKGGLKRVVGEWVDGLR